MWDVFEGGDFIKFDDFLVENRSSMKLRARCEHDSGTDKCASSADTPLQCVMSS